MGKIGILISVVNAIRTRVSRLCRDINCLEARALTVALAEHTGYIPTNYYTHAMLFTIYNFSKTRERIAYKSLSNWAAVCVLQSRCVMWLSRTMRIAIWISTNNAHFSPFFFFLHTYDAKSVIDHIWLFPYYYSLGYLRNDGETRFRQNPL